MANADKIMRVGFLNSKKLAYRLATLKLWRSIKYVAVSFKYALLTVLLLVGAHHYKSHLQI